MTLGSFHEGELAAQELAGVQLQGAAIREEMPDQHRSFFTLLPFLPIAAVDPAGWPAATILTGPPGFITSPDPRTLEIGSTAAPNDPAATSFRPGARIGALGIDLATRRRNRVNGRITDVGTGGLTIAVEQSFGNCPQYIQARELNPAPPAELPGGPAENLVALDAEAAGLIRAADTFFVASTSGERAQRAGGVDISHRGGRPGFVRVDGETLTIPDFRGNRYFNTLGNFLLCPRAALVFVDFARGDLLHLSGEVEVAWSSTEAARFQGAERLWRVRVSHGWRRRGALSLRWSLRGYAPTTERTGSWAA